MTIMLRMITGEILENIRKKKWILIIKDWQRYISCTVSFIYTKLFSSHLYIGSTGIVVKITTVCRWRRIRGISRISNTHIVIVSIHSHVLKNFNVFEETFLLYVRSFSYIFSSKLYFHIRSVKMSKRIFFHSICFYTKLLIMIRSSLII